MPHNVVSSINDKDYNTEYYVDHLMTNERASFLYRKVKFLMMLQSAVVKCKKGFKPVQGYVAEMNVSCLMQDLVSGGKLFSGDTKVVKCEKRGDFF